MNDFFVGLAFLVMVLSPCVVALNSGVVIEDMEAIEDDSHGIFIPR